MGAPEVTGPLGVRQERRVRASNREVVRLHRDRRQHSIDVQLSLVSPAPVGELDPDQELGGRDRRDRDVVVVPDQRVEGRAVPLCSYEDRRVEDQSLQRLSSSEAFARVLRSSASQLSSSGPSRRSPFTIRPVPADAGSRRATTRPCRTITNRSPQNRIIRFLRDSTASTSLSAPTWLGTHDN